MILQDKKFLLFSNCVPVKGFSRSAIYDLHRFDYDYIPNDLYDILTDDDGYIDCSKFYGIYKEDKESLNTFKEYVSFLLEKEYIFSLEGIKREHFPKIDYIYHYPSLITNITININREAEFLKKIIYELNELNCNYVSLRITDIIDFQQLKKFVNHFKESTVYFLEIILSYHSSLKIDVLTNLCNENKYIKKITIYRAIQNKKFNKRDDNLGELIYTKKAYTVNNEDYKKDFFVNIRYFSEAISKNSFFNGKAYINDKGFISNSSSSEEIFGNIKIDSLKEIIMKPEFQKYWSITKDNILICKDCEHRYMCFDKRIPLKSEDNLWRLEPECEYNPYNNNWVNS